MEYYLLKHLAVIKKIIYEKNTLPGLYTWPSCKYTSK